MILSDTAAERAVLAGICSYGEEIYIDINDLVNEKCFTVDSNGLIFRCIKHIYDKDAKLNIDIASIYSAASEIGISHLLTSKEEAQHLRAILEFPVSKDNVRKFGKVYHHGNALDLNEKLAELLSESDQLSRDAVLFSKDHYSMINACQMVYNQIIEASSNA